MAEVSSAGCSQLCGARGGREGSRSGGTGREALDHYQDTVFHSSPREGTPSELSTHYSVSQPQSRGIICSYQGTYLLASPANPRRGLAPQIDVYLLIFPHKLIKRHC